MGGNLAELMRVEARPGLTGATDTDRTAGGDDMDLDGRSAIVTGGAGGLGGATVRHLAEPRRSAWRSSTATPTGPATLAKELGDRAVAVGGDVNDDDAVAAAIEAAQLGRHALAGRQRRRRRRSAAGARSAATARPHDKDVFVGTMEMNAFGTFNVTRLAAAAMAANEPDEHGQRGVVVNTASIAGIEGQTGQLAYAAAKAAILGMTLPLARDLAAARHPGVRHRPGTMGTPIMLSVPEEMQQQLEPRTSCSRSAWAGPRSSPSSSSRSPATRTSTARTSGSTARCASRRSSAVLTIDALLDALRLEPAGPDRYTAPNAEAGHGVVFGGQLLAQSIVAAPRGNDDKRVKTVHTIFARGRPSRRSGGDRGRPHARRARVRQQHGDDQPGRPAVHPVAGAADRRRARLHPPRRRRPEPCRRPTRPRPATARVRGRCAWRVASTSTTPTLVGPADLDVWTRFVGAPGDPVVDQALLAFATDGFLIATAMRPHDGVGQSQAHVTVSTGVVSHTLTFHEPAPRGSGCCCRTTARTRGGAGRTARADVFRADGALVASFVQDAMIRPLPGDRTGAAL